MTSARWAGLTYLFLIAMGIFSLAYAPEQYAVHGDAAATLVKLSNNLLLFKSAIVAELACYASFMLLAVLLYKVFHDWSQTLALLMLAFVLVSVPIGFIAVGEKLALLELLDTGAGQAAAVETHLSRYAALRTLAEVFWGLWLLPYGLLVLKSRAIPWFFGVALILGCCSYLAGVIAPLFWQGYFDSAVGQFSGVPSALGEIGGALWLTVMGARVRRR